MHRTGRVNIQTYFMRNVRWNFKFEFYQVFFIFSSWDGLTCLWSLNKSKVAVRRCSTKWCSYKFRIIHIKTHLSESLFERSCRLEASKFIKKATLAQVFAREFFEIFKNTFLTQHLQKTASKGRHFNNSRFRIKPLLLHIRKPIVDIPLCCNNLLEMKLSLPVGEVSFSIQIKILTLPLQ